MVGGHGGADEGQDVEACHHARDPERSVDDGRVRRPPQPADADRGQHAQQHGHDEVRPDR